MALRYTIDSGRQLVRISAAGELSGQDLLGVFCALQADADFSAAYDQLMDSSGAAVIELSADDVRACAVVSPFRHGSRSAIVAPTTLLYGLARMFIAYAEPYGPTYRVFRTTTSAEDWLGISQEPELEPEPEPEPRTIRKALQTP